MLTATKPQHNKLLIILGPTATGKTDLAVYLAKKLNGELISCDSRQVYKGLDIGTGKLPGGEVAYSKHDGYWILDGIKIWFYDILSPADRYTAGDYIKDAREKIIEITKDEKLPIIVGGTGFYIDSLFSGLSYSTSVANQKLRVEYEKLPLEILQKKLKLLNPDFFSGLNNSDRNNKRRIVRYIEIYSLNENLLKIKKKDGFFNNFDILKIGLTTVRERLYKRIDNRVDKRIKTGMIDEAKSLYKGGLSLERMKELGLEYRMLAEFIQNKLTQEEMIQRLKNKIHQYAKRQLTWFKRDKKIIWFDILEKDFFGKVEKRVLDWYNS